MALDPLFFDTYKRYKAGTSKLVSFLASTARKTKLIDHLFPTDLPIKSGRLKGKARAAQRQKGQTYQIRIADFVPMAEAIASAPEIISVPETLMRTLEEVIAARKECAESFSHHTDENTQYSNAAHEHFIEILETVRDILVPKKHVKKPTKKVPSEKEVDNIGNLFEYLDVEEPAECTYGDASISDSSKSKDMSDTIYELEPSDEDKSFAIFCLFKDLTDIRHLVRQTWAEYREKQVALTTAAVTMNTAITLFRRLNENFVAEFPQFDEHHKIIWYLSTAYQDPNGETGEDFGSYTGTGFRLYSKIFFCDHTCELLNNWFLLGAELPFYQQTSHEYLNHTKDEEELFKCLSVLGLLASHYEECFKEDQLLKAISITRKAKKIYTWVVFAVQLLVDTRRVVNKELDRCLKDFSHLQQWLSTTVNETLRFGETNGVNGWYKLNSGNLLAWRKAMEQLCQGDFVQEVMDKYLKDRSVLYRWGPFFLFRNHPMLPGLLIQRSLTQFHSYGVGLTGDQASVLVTIHLYNAAQQSGSMSKSKEYIDLEKIISWQGSSYLFVGEKRPQNVQEFFSHFGLATGVSPIAMSRNRHGKGTYNFDRRGLPNAMKHFRKLRPMSKFVKLALEEVYPGKVGLNIMRESRAANDPLVMLELVVAGELQKKDTAKQVQNIEKPTKITPLSMISILKDFLKADEIVLRFDLFALNQRIVELLRRIQTICVEQSPIDYEDYEGDVKANGVISHMLAGEIGGPTLPRYQPTRFKEAASLLEEVVDKEGDAEFEKAKERCFVEESDKVVVDTFETPFEDNILFSEREMLGQANVICVDGDGGMRRVL